MKKTIYRLIIIIALVFVGVIFYSKTYLYNTMYFLKPPFVIDNAIHSGDKNKDGISDAAELIKGARQEIANHVKYHSDYYIGGYPPSTEGVCTDVIWRSAKYAGYNIKRLVDKDIRNNLSAYSAVIKEPDPNIDFRRVKNLYIYFKRHAIELTTDVKLYDKENLASWQAGDIVVMKKSDHVAIVSDKRRRDGVPLIIHNSSTYAMEQDRLLQWQANNRIIGHFRLK